jgi:site-specific DNA-methyltransferase (adenine-specific)
LYGAYAPHTSSEHESGRWPANLLLDDLAAELLDQQSGTLKSGGNPARRGSAKFKTCYGEFKGQETCTVHRGANSGGASRFFYCSKASKKERSGSLHPTVKPLNLMRYLCRLVTPPGGLILDPFMGSGSTAVAAVQEGFHIIGFEIDPGYHADACRRLAAALHPPEGVPGPATPTLAAFGVQNP